MKARHVLAVLLLLVAAGVAAEPGFKVESIAACTDPSLSDAVRAELAPEGIKVSSSTGVLCEVWLRKAFPQKAGATAADYSSLATGVFTGVIRYPAKGGDFRGQAVRPGTYTMRYQTIPSDGNHLGVSPTSDFFLLVPAADDKDPKATIEYNELIRLSKLAAGTNHPNPLYLAAPAGKAPSFGMNADERGVLELKGKAASGADFPIALTLIGKAEG